MRRSSYHALCEWVMRSIVGMSHGHGTIGERSTNKPAGSRHRSLVNDKDHRLPSQASDWSRESGRGAGPSREQPCCSLTHTTTTHNKLHTIRAFLGWPLQLPTTSGGTTALKAALWHLQRCVGTAKTPYKYIYIYIYNPNKSPRHVMSSATWKNHRKSQSVATTISSQQPPARMPSL